MYIMRILSVLSFVFLMVGCSSIRHYTAPDDENLLSGAGSVAVGKKADGSAKDSTEAFEMVDIDKLLKAYGFENPDAVSKQLASIEEWKYKRNDLQDRLLAASNQRCGAYLRMLTSSKSQTQMGWSGLSLFLSSAASVTSPASAVKILSAGSAVSTGFLSLYNEAYFNNMTINIISTGIAKQREGLLSQITAQRREPLSEYPVNRAIADALVYHSACSIIAGLDAAAAATQEAAAEKITKKIR